MHKEVRKQRDVVWKHLKNYVKGKNNKREEESKKDRENLTRESRKLKELKKEKNG